MTDSETFKYVPSRHWAPSANLFDIVKEKQNLTAQALES